MPKEKTNIVENTTRRVNNNPMEMFAKSMVMGTTGAIESQEKQGQNQLIKSDVLPIEFQRKGEKAILKSFGVKFGNPVQGDDLFQYAELPEGWEKVRTDHSMWSNLVDEKGRVRAGIFYKAAFYDRSAHISLSRRYGLKKDFNDKEIILYHVTDCDKPIYSTSPTKAPQPEYGDEWFATDEEAKKEVQNWLDEHYPDWGKVEAYWDD